MKQQNAPAIISIGCNVGTAILAYMSDQKFKEIKEHLDDIIDKEE